MKLCILAFLVFMTLCIPVFAETQYNHIEGSNFKFSYNNRGITLVNETPCELKDIRIQTYPLSSSAFSRIMGTGSYYYKYDRLGSDKYILAKFNKFSNKEGIYLDISQYAFKRISFSAKQSCEGGQYFSQHFNLNL